MISVLILTKNEAANIRACLESVAWSDDIVVLDDHSTDSTVAIAQSMGARVLIHSAGGERQQRNYSITQIVFKYDWVYNPDADEITPPDLRDEMLQVVSRRDIEIVAYRVRFKNMLMGRWIRRASLYPTWVVRLFKPEHLRFERDINLEYHVLGAEGRLQSHFLHFSFNKGMSEWFAKHNRYSDAEALEALRSLEVLPIKLSSLITEKNTVVRRRMLKAYAWRLPGRPMLVFLYLLVVRGGLFDGVAGVHYCILRMIYEYMIDVKILEHRRLSFNRQSENKPDRLDI